MEKQDAKKELQVSVQQLEQQGLIMPKNITDKAMRLTIRRLINNLFFACIFPKAQLILKPQISLKIN